MRKLIVACLLVATWSISVAPPASASCTAFDLDRSTEGADAVFTGTVVNAFESRGDITNPAVGVIEVEAVHKGEVLTQQAVAVPNPSSSSVGYEFVVGQRIAVFATAESGLGFDLEPDIYASSGCGIVEADTVQFPTNGDLPTIGETAPTVVQDQLGTTRPSLLPEALIFVGVLVFVLGLASAFTLRDRRRAAG